MRSIRIYEQAADKVDPGQLAAFDKAVAAVTAEGVEVERLRLGRNPEAFRRSLVTRRLIEVEGEDKLPATTVDELIMLYGRYPSADQLRRYAGAQKAVRSITVPDPVGTAATTWSAAPGPLGASPAAAPGAPRRPAVVKPGSGAGIEVPMADRSHPGGDCGCSSGSCGCSPGSAPDSGKPPTCVKEDAS